MINTNKHLQSFCKTFIFFPLLIVSFLLSQVETKAQVRESNTTTEASNFEKELEGINDAESIIINGKKVAKNELVENYILVGDFQYDEQSKTLSISTPTEFPELYYSDLSKFPEELKKRDDDNFLKGFTYFQLTSDDKISAVKINDHQYEDGAETASQSDNNNTKLDDENTVYLVDGKEIDKDQLNTIKPEQIASMNVKKSVALIKEKGYDTEKVKGLVEITTKE
ncbi:hypothetical protein ACFQ0R_04650 [Psychroflexus salinarum]|uniref:Uncharacterized protein n=1 Tax=Psychroflexus salinarum TaxID=546024 RepID=A0ABW3GN30_9FLAO